MANTVSSLLTPAQRRQVMAALNQFYAQPVARVSFELFVTVIAVIFFAIFAIRPTLLTMSDLIKEIEEKRELDQTLTQKIAALNTGQTVYLNLQNRLAVLDEAIPTQPELIPAIKIIEKIASDRNLAILSLGVQEFPLDSPTDLRFQDMSRRSVTISISVSGTYPVIRQFIEDLRQSQRTFIVESVTFSTTDQRGQKTLRCSISVSVPYFGSEEKTESTPTAPVGGVGLGL